jgi:hypothetical protein
MDPSPFCRSVLFVSTLPPTHYYCIQPWVVWLGWSGWNARTRGYLLCLVGEYFSLLTYFYFDRLASRSPPTTAFALRVSDSILVDWDWNAGMTDRARFFFGLFCLVVGHGGRGLVLFNLLVLFYSFPFLVYCLVMGMKRGKVASVLGWDGVGECDGGRRRWLFWMDQVRGGRGSWMDRWMERVGKGFQRICE